MSRALYKKGQPAQGESIESPEQIDQAPASKTQQKGLFVKVKGLDVVAYFVVIALSIAFLYFGNGIVADDFGYGAESENTSVYTARVSEIVERTVDEYEVSEDFIISETVLHFNAEITNGELEGETVLIQHFISDMIEASDREPEVGDRIVVGHMEDIDSFTFLDYQRGNYILILALVFFLLVVVFGKMKGFNSLVALGFTCMAVFLVLIPAILSGHNIYLIALIVCLYSIVSTLLIVVGVNKKSAAAILGCLGGVLLAASLMLLMDGIMHLTGLVESDSRLLLYLPLEITIDLRAILFAGVILGSTGAIMDVAMSISSALWEVRLADARANFKSLLRSGIEIGKDTLGTMLNTLVLAYIGSSLTLILLLSAHSTSLTELLNSEMATAEFLRALIGGFGMFFAIPLTAIICAWWFVRTKLNDDDPVVGVADASVGAETASQGGLVRDDFAPQDELPEVEGPDQRRYVNIPL